MACLLMLAIGDAEYLLWAESGEKGEGGPTGRARGLAGLVVEFFGAAHCEETLDFWCVFIFGKDGAAFE